MRFMAIVKCSPEFEAGAMPTEAMMTEMAKFNEQLVKAGVLLDAGGLLPTSKGARVKFSGSRRTVVDGPFSETKEMIAGYWVLQVKSKEEAIEWIKRVPFQDSEIDLRQFGDPDDYGSEMTPALRAAEERVAQQMKANTKH